MKFNLKFHMKVMLDGDDVCFFFFFLAFVILNGFNILAFWNSLLLFVRCAFENSFVLLCFHWNLSF